MQAFKTLIQNVGSYAGLLALAMSLYLLMASRPDNTRIGYVRSQDLIYGYAGMKEVEGTYQERLATKRAHLDSLFAGLQRDAAQLQSRGDGMGQAGENAAEDTLRMRQVQLEAYSRSLASEAEKEEAEMVEGVLTQINSFVADYAKANGFKMIYGTTSDGSILYGDEDLDITDELLTALNEHYGGKSN